MSSDATDNPAVELQALRWDGQDVPARRATLTRILVRISRDALQGASLDSLLKGICECLVAELPVAIASVPEAARAVRNFSWSSCSASLSSFVASSPSCTSSASAMAPSSQRPSHSLSLSSSRNSCQWK